MKKLLNNPKPVVIAIVVIIVLFGSYKAFATEMELGATFASEFNGGYSLSIRERFIDKIDVGVTLVSEQDYKGTTLSNNGVIWAAFVAKKPETWWKVLPSEVAIGATHWIETSPFIGCQQGYMLNLRWRLPGNWVAGVWHGSNAGVCKPNHGQDLLTLGWDFK